MAKLLLRFDIRRAGKLLLGIFLGVLVANLVFYVLLTRPKVLEHRALTVDSAPRLRALERRQSEVEEKEEYAAALDQAQVDLERLRGDVLSTKPRRMIEVQLELAKLARQFGITLERVQYENDILEEEGLERFGMVVPLEGSYTNLRNFIQAVENSDKFLVIERVALAQGQEGGVLLQLNITLATYFDAPETESGRSGRGAGRA